jgi:hypothetical protein
MTDKKERKVYVWMNQPSGLKINIIYTNDTKSVYVGLLTFTSHGGIYPFFWPVYKQIPRPVECDRIEPTIFYLEEENDLEYPDTFISCDDGGNITVNNTRVVCKTQLKNL